MQYFPLRIFFYQTGCNKNMKKISSSMFLLLCTIFNTHRTTSSSCLKLFQENSLQYHTIFLNFFHNKIIFFQSSFEDITIKVQILLAWVRGCLQRYWNRITSYTLHSSCLVCRSFRETYTHGLDHKSVKVLLQDHSELQHMQLPAFQSFSY